MIETVLLYCDITALFISCQVFTVVHSCVCMCVENAIEHRQTPLMEIIFLNDHVNLVSLFTVS